MQRIAYVILIIVIALNVRAYSQQRENLAQPFKSSDIETETLYETAGDLAVESFEGTSFHPAGWNRITNFSGAGWQRGEVGQQVPGFGLTDIIDAPSGGGSFVAFASWATGDADGLFSPGQPTDQWLITPQILNVQPNDSLIFYLRYFSQFGDNLDVLISTAGDTIAAFDTVVAELEFRGAGNNAWQKYAYALTDFADPGSDIYVAFRERVSNNATLGDALFLDLVEVVSLVTDVAGPPTSPERFELAQNYPNPFNPSTQITFVLPQRATVFLRVFNLLGQQVAAILNGVSYSPGRHRATWNAGGLPNGIYFYKIEAGGFVDIKRMTLMK
ncbi:MAG TPA: choice-of-anchor J domain-containing protein [bacterium]